MERRFRLYCPNDCAWTIKVYTRPDDVIENPSDLLETVHARCPLCYETWHSDSFSLKELTKWKSKRATNDELAEEAAKWDSGEWKPTDAGWEDVT